MAILPPHIPRLRRHWADEDIEAYPYSKILKDNVVGNIPNGLPVDELRSLAARYAIYLAEHLGQKLTFDKIVNLNINGELLEGGSRRKKSKKTSKKVSKKKSSKKTKTQVGGAKKRKSKKTSKKTSKKSSKKTSRK